MATFWERAAHSINRMFSLHYLYLLASNFGFVGGVLVLIAPAPNLACLFIHCVMQKLLVIKHL